MRFLLIYGILIHVAIAATPKKSTLKSQLNLTLTNVLKRARISSNQIGYAIYDLEDGRLVDAYNQNRSFIPASVNKILSCYMALVVLGPEYRFSTEIWTHPNPERPDMKDLYFVGGADPSLDSKSLMRLVLQLKQSQFKDKIQNFYFIENLFPKTQIISDIGLDDQAYNPGLGPLSVSYNRFTVFTDKKGTQTPIPAVASLVIEKKNEKFSPGKKFNFYSDERIEKWFSSTRVKYRRYEAVPVRNPGLWTSELLRFLAKKEKLFIPKAQKAIELPKQAKKEIELKSVPLQEIVNLTLEYSNNLYAESMYLYTLKTLNREPISLVESGKYFKDWLKRHFTDVDWENAHFANGSGLSTLNRVSPKQFSRALVKTHGLQIKQDAYWNLLSISGESGFLRKKYRRPSMAFNIWAKTGSLDYVNNLAGYFYGKQNKKYAFTLFINDLEKRQLANGTNSTRVERLRQQAKGWKVRTNQVLESILQHWLDRF